MSTPLWKVLAPPQMEKHLRQNMTSLGEDLFDAALTFVYRPCSGFDAGPLADHLSRHTPIPIPYRDPIDWARWISTATAALGFVLLLRFLAPIFQNRWSWAIVTIVTSLVMTSGFMFTRIRGSPFTGGGGNWIAGGYQNQFGQEVSVVAFICKNIRFDESTQC